MATNKHATIRYQALDRCFSNFGRKFFIEDLVAACRDALYEFTGIEDGVKQRQIFEDIRFMESSQGWAIPLERIPDGKMKYYRYTDKSFSINKQALTPAEASQITETLSILTRFKGMPHFNWIEEVQIRLKEVFHFKGDSNSFVGFEQNPYLKGLDFFGTVFNAILNQRALRLTYQGFKQLEPTNALFHPYYLKQYNRRWFVFGFNQDYEAISNFALDRIIEAEETNDQYIENDTIDFEEYFEDMVGVSSDLGDTPEVVILEINKDVWPYIETKPLHGSQKVIERAGEFVRIQLEVIINFELTTLLFSFGDGLKIIDPEQLKQAVITKAENLIKKYF
ncbi:MAG: WYL domain-containing protein [Bacteroidales bacterium]|nr:WYL domain-containing protein [Bacteroidales bacterium]